MTTTIETLRATRADLTSAKAEVARGLSAARDPSSWRHDDAIAEGTVAMWEVSYRAYDVAERDAALALDAALAVAARARARVARVRARCRERGWGIMVREAGLHFTTYGIIVRDDGTMIGTTRDVPWGMDAIAIDLAISIAEEALDAIACR